MDFAASIRRRHVLAALAGVAVLVGLIASPELLGDDVGRALGELADASPGWLWLAAGAFLAGIAALGYSWRAALRCLGAEIGGLDSTARYGIGSFANALLPGGIGAAIRIGLYARTLDAPHRLWTAGGVGAAVDLARGLVLGALVLVAAALGTFPVWPVLVLAGLAVAVVLVALVGRGRLARGRAAHLFEAFRALGRSPRAAAELLGWIAVATLARVAAAASIVAALGIGRPVQVALVVVPALALAGMVQLTPGNVGVASGAIAVTLHAQGVGLSSALSAGIAFHALETAVSIAVGAAGMLYLARPLPAWTLRLAGSGACLTLAAALGATFLA